MAAFPEQFEAFCTEWKDLTGCATAKNGLFGMHKYWVSWRGRILGGKAATLTDDDWRALTTLVVDSLADLDGALRGSAFQSGSHLSVSCVVTAQDGSTAIAIARDSCATAISNAGASADFGSDKDWIARKLVAA